MACTKVFGLMLLLAVLHESFCFTVGPTGATVNFKHSLKNDGASTRKIGYQMAADGPMDRREALRRVGSTGASLGLLSILSPQSAFASPGPVVVLGAGGKTGKECVYSLLRNGVPCIATSRSGAPQLDAAAVAAAGGGKKKEGALLSFAAANVVQETTLTEVITPGIAGVIFAASASKKGGTAKEVDYEGLVKVAKACIAAEVPRLVVVSSGGVSKPDSAVYKFLNLFGEIMKYKVMGEDEVKALYAAAGNPALGYTVVRPGGLTEEPAKGVAALELNQGDTKSGRIARADVAEIAVRALLDPAAKNTVFECYDADTSKPLNAVGASNIMKKKTSTEEAAATSTGLERRADSWGGLFKGLKPDKF
uniref:NAD(P)-binding domain-containing protein n=1 Tax=Heterosigma akashiwo TaxID=2829 RepID=A0A7S3UTL3_HETAK